MKIEVKKTEQFPNGVVDLRGLEGGETILMDAALGQVIWLKGQATGNERLFGSMRIHTGQGPHGFGFEVGRSVGDVPLVVRTEDAADFGANDASVYELTESRIREMTDPHRWRPRRR